MKYLKKVQEAIFKSLMKEALIVYDNIDDYNIIISISGACVFTLPEKDICFNLEKCKRTDLRKLYAGIKANDEQLTLTNDLRKVDKIMIQKLYCSDFDIWVDNKYITYIEDYADNINFYASSEKDRIILVWSDSGKVIGSILPFNVKGGKEE